MSCRVSGCTKQETVARGLCGTHYSRWQREIDLEKPVRLQRYAINATCAVAGCNGKVLAKKLCSLHYQRLVKSGSPEAERAPINHPTLRWCPMCQRNCDRQNDFYVVRKTGRTTVYCKPCAKKRNDISRKKRTVKLLAYKRAYSARNRDKIRAQSRARYARNPDAMIDKVQRRQALVRGAHVSTMTLEAWRSIVESFDGRCAYCLCKVARPERDHVIAVTRGGADSPENVVPACKTCNTRKNNRPVFFMASETTRATVSI